MIQWPENLVKDIARRKSVLFLGAGISKNSTNTLGHSPKDWEEFLRAGINYNNMTVQQKRTIKKYVDNKEYLIACELLKKNLGRDEFKNLLNREFLTPKFSHSQIHEDIFKLDSRLVITPNFDKIYDVYASSQTHGTTITKVYYDEDIADYIRKDGRLILKIHGCIDTPDKLIFTRRDYSNARSEHKFFYSILEALIATHTFIFLGAGMNDPDIKLLMEDYAFRYKNARKHYFVLPKQAIKQEVKELNEESMNLDIITYDNRNNHKEFLDSISSLVKLVEDERAELSLNQQW